MRALVIILVALCVVPGLATGASVGAYVGAGPSRLADEQARCVHEAPAEVALHPDPQRPGAWAFTIQRFAFFPLDPCGGLSVSTTTWPSTFAGEVFGSPEEGFTGVGGETIAGAPWELTISPVGLQTTWSLYRVQFIEGYGYYRSWWNGTAVMAGAHA